MGYYEVMSELSPEDNHILNELLVPATGPTPFHMPSLAGLSWKGKALSWYVPPDPEDIPQGSLGVVYGAKGEMLLRGGDTVLGVVDSGIFVFPHKESGVLYTAISNSKNKSEVIVRSYPVDQLEEFPEDKIINYGYAGELHTTIQKPSEFRFTVPFESQTMEVLFPPKFKAWGRFLLFITGDSMEKWYLLDIDTEQDKVKVVPQNWFNKPDTHESGYEWLMYAVRDPKDGRIYGEAMRMGIFELSEDGCELERWVVQ